MSYEEYVKWWQSKQSKSGEFEKVIPAGQVPQVPQVQMPEPPAVQVDLPNVREAVPEPLSGALTHSVPANALNKVDSVEEPAKADAIIDAAAAKLERKKLKKERKQALAALALVQAATVAKRADCIDDVRLSAAASTVVSTPLAAPADDGTNEIRQSGASTCLAPATVPLGSSQAEISCNPSQTKIPDNRTGQTDPVMLEKDPLVNVNREQSLLQSKVQWSSNAQENVQQAATSAVQHMGHLEPTASAQLRKINKAPQKSILPLEPEQQPSQQVQQAQQSAEKKCVQQQGNKSHRLQLERKAKSHESISSGQCSDSESDGETSSASSDIAEDTPGLTLISLYPVGQALAADVETGPLSAADAPKCPSSRKNPEVALEVMDPLATAAMVIPKVGQELVADQASGIDVSTITIPVKTTTESISALAQTVVDLEASSNESDGSELPLAPISDPYMTLDIGDVEE